MAATKEHVPGNDECIATLKAAYDKACQGMVGYVAVVIVEGTQYSCGVSGNINLEPIVIEGLDKCKNDIIIPAQQNRKVPEPDPILDESYRVYNVAMGPASYDVIPWLIDAEMIKRKAGITTPLKVAFWEGKDKSGAAAPNRRRMLDAVMKPAVELIGGVLDDKALYGHEKALYTVQDVQKKALEGEEVPFLKAPEVAVQAMRKWLGDKNRIITITLRETDEWNHRNSSIPDWIKFAGYLETKGYTPIIVRDTAKCFDSPVSKYEECPQASLNIHNRMALYELADCNMMCSNGPMNLCLFSHKPWAMFVVMEEENSVYAPATKSFSVNHFGLDPDTDQQHVWCTPKQRIVRKPDTYENLVEWFEKVFLADEVSVDASEGG